MKVSQFLATLARSVRFLMVMVACAIMLFAQAPTAAASGSPSSQPTDGTVQLDKILDKTEDVLRSPPSLEKVERESSRGLNEVQGAADADKMKRSSRSETKLPIEQELEGVLKNAKKK